jgi:hypothetical protein
LTFFATQEKPQFSVLNQLLISLIIHVDNELCSNTQHRHPTWKAEIALKVILLLQFVEEFLVASSNPTEIAQNKEFRDSLALLIFLLDYIDVLKFDLPD